MRLLNLGCGNRYNTEWVNIDFVATPPHVMGHNLLKGIPFPDAEFDAVYHSHVLEHFSKKDGVNFIKECYRILKPGGVIRIAVPDLEGIVRCYLEQLESALKGDELAALNYDWILLEMYDQTVREQPGGEMLKYLQQKTLANEDFIVGRIGMEAMNIRNSMKRTQQAPAIKTYYSLTFKKIISSSSYKNFLKRILSKKKVQHTDTHTTIGQFRKGGEIHQWMYDKYSLSKLLSSVGFKDIAKRSAFESSLKNWNNYELESKNGIIFKPDSLFIEAIK